MYEDCKPNHPEWGIVVTGLDGIITSINDDGTFEVKFHHPLDSYGVMGHSATMDVENTDFWMSDKHIERSIKRFKKSAKIGDKVKVNEYRNLFYITTFLERPPCALAWVSRKGEPHLGFKQKHSIDVSF